MFVILLCFIISACGKDEQADQSFEKLVKTIVVADPKDYTSFSYPGIVAANQNVDLAFQVSGQLVKFPIVEGQLVDKDQLLGKLDSRDFQNTFNCKASKL